MAGLYRNVVATFVRSILSAASAAYTAFYETPVNVYTRTTFASGNNATVQVDCSAVVSERATAVVVAMTIQSQGTAPSPASVRGRVDDKVSGKSYRGTAITTGTHLLAESTYQYVVQIDANNEFDFTPQWVNPAAGSRIDIDVVGELVS